MKNAKKGALIFNHYYTPKYDRLCSVNNGITYCFIIGMIIGIVGSAIHSTVLFLLLLVLSPFGLTIVLLTIYSHFSENRPIQHR
jgi:hypothetical protein